jgi:hypothetical protein
MIINSNVLVYPSSNNKKAFPVIIKSHTEKGNHPSNSPHPHTPYHHPKKELPAATAPP